MFSTSTRFWTHSMMGVLTVSIGLVVLAVWLPRFVPDSQILLESDLTGNWDIYRMDMNRDMLINLTHSPDNDHDPAWSASTQQIAFSSDRDHDTATEIYVMGGGGDHLRRVTSPDGIYWKPTWLPDGRLAVVFNFGNIQILDLTANRDDFLTYGFAPVWSPDGLRVAYDIDHPRIDSNVDIYTFEAERRVLRNLTGNPANDWGPSWSPDGKSLAFVSTRDGNAEIYVMNVVCAVDAPCVNSVQRITHEAAFDQSPTWSPDGRQIIFGSDRDGSSQIYVMNADGSGVRKITDGKANHAAPVWVK